MSTEPLDESGLAPLKPSVPAQPVTVVGFNMPFLDLVVFMVKFAIATIPAAVILFFVFAFVSAMFGSFGAPR